jgi:hypothetical protein
MPRNMAILSHSKRTRAAAGSAEVMIQYEARKTGRSAGEVRRAIKKVGNGRTKVTAALSRGR